jgi:hypothetical protein
VERGGALEVVAGGRGEPYHLYRKRGGKNASRAHRTLVSINTSCSSARPATSSTTVHPPATTSRAPPRSTPPLVATRPSPHRACKMWEIVRLTTRVCRDTGKCRSVAETTFEWSTSYKYPLALISRVWYSKYIITHRRKLSDWRLQFLLQLPLDMVRHGGWEKVCEEEKFV